MMTGSGSITHTINVVPVGGTDEISVSLTVGRHRAPLTADQIADIGPVVEAMEYYAALLAGEVEEE